MLLETAARGLVASATGTRQRMNSYDTPRKWLRGQRAKGYRHGLLVATKAAHHNTPSTIASPGGMVALRSAVSSATWEKGWRLYLFEEEADRDALKARLPRRTYQADPLAAGDVKGPAA